MTPAIREYAASGTARASVVIVKPLPVAVVAANETRRLSATVSELANGLALTRAVNPVVGAVVPKVC